VAEPSVFEKAVLDVIAPVHPTLGKRYAIFARAREESPTEDEVMELVREILTALATSNEARAAVEAALEANDQTCHTGSPRGISDVYCYIPVPFAAFAILDAIRPKP